MQFSKITYQSQLNFYFKSFLQIKLRFDHKKARWDLSNKGKIFVCKTEWKTANLIMMMTFLAVLPVAETLRFFHRTRSEIHRRF